RRVEHRLGAPAAGAEILPGTEVVCDPADRVEPVHRRTAAEAAAAAVRERLLAARADRARAVPVERGGARLRGLERQAEALRAVAKLDRGVGGPIIGAGFQQEHGSGRRRAEPFGDQRPGRSGTHHDVVPARHVAVPPGVASYAPMRTPRSSRTTLYLSINPSNTAGFIGHIRTTMRFTRTKDVNSLTKIVPSCHGEQRDRRRC